MSLGPKFTVVIPTYNRLELLKGALESVSKQTFTSYEIVVVDDGSDDGTQEYLHSFGGKVQSLRQVNRGPGAARNVGARQARGDYVAFLDSDDLWFPWTLEVFSRAIQEHQNPHIIAGKWIEFSDVEGLRRIQEETLVTSYFSDYFASSYHPFSVGSGTCVLRRETLERTKFLEDRLNAEDHDLILRMGTLPGFVQIVAPFTVGWRRHSTSETGDFKSSVSGTLRLLMNEKSGIYPGGSKRSHERHRIVARHSRSIALECLRKGAAKHGWRVYCSTFAWNVELNHWKYLIGFPMLWIWALVGRATNR